MFLSRRQFLKVTTGTVAAVALADKALALTALQPVVEGAIPSANILTVPGSGCTTISIGTIPRSPGFALRMIPTPAASVRLCGMGW